jgi:hypothetical protein
MSFAGPPAGAFGPHGQLGLDVQDQPAPEAPMLGLDPNPAPPSTALPAVTVDAPEATPDTANPPTDPMGNPLGTPQYGDPPQTSTQKGDVEGWSQHGKDTAPAPAPTPTPTPVAEPAPAPPAAPGQKGTPMQGPVAPTPQAFDPNNPALIGLTPEQIQQVQDPNNPQFNAPIANTPQPAPVAPPQAVVAPYATSPNKADTTVGPNSTITPMMSISIAEAIANALQGLAEDTGVTATGPEGDIGGFSLGGYGPAVGFGADGTLGGDQGGGVTGGGSASAAAEGATSEGGTVGDAGSVSGGGSASAGISGSPGGSIGSLGGIGSDAGGSAAAASAAEGAAAASAAGVGTGDGGW